MKNILNTTPVLNVATQVEGSNKIIVVRVPTEAVADIVNELPRWKRFNRTLGNKWCDVSALGLAIMSLEYGDMAVKGIQPEDDHLMEMHCKGSIWLLHRLGKIGKAVARAQRDMAILKINPGRGLKGVHVTFEAIRPELRAANDNVSVSRRASGLH